MSFLKGAWLFQVGPNGQNGNEIESASLAGSKDLPVPWPDDFFKIQKAIFFGKVPGAGF